MTNIMPKAPYTGTVIDWPVDPRIRRSFYTDTPNMSTKIEEDTSVVPDIVANAKPRLGDTSIIEILQKVLQQQDSEKQVTAMPSNLDYRK
jgi:hypothetical protein